MSTDLLTIQEAAAILRMNVRSLKRLAKRQAVPCILLPDGDYRFISRDLEMWVESHRYCTTDETKQIELQLDLMKE